jgi:hypothetical protein
MNRICFSILGFFLIVSCSKSKDLCYGNDVLKKTKQHSTSEFPSSNFQPEISLFMQALSNSWDSLDVETQNFFNERLIKTPKNNISFQMIEKQQDEDARIISGWSEEKKKWFAENFFYKDIFFRNDTLVVVK